MEPAQYPLASFRRKVTLNVGNYENQKAEQHRDFQDIVDKEDSLKADIKNLKDQIKKLETIQGILDKLEIPVEKED